MTKLLANWKSTTLGLCILGLALKGSLQFDAAGHLAMTPRDWFGAAFGLCAAAIGVLQTDAGTQIAQTPEGVKAVPSHENPDDGSKPVVSQ